MTTISIIGSGTMASAIGTRAAKYGHNVEVLSRNSARAQALADQIGTGATVGTYGATPLGDIVVVAVPYTDVVSAVADYGEPLAGKILVDISNTFNADASALATTTGSSATQEIAAVVPDGTQVVKALNTIFGHVLVRNTPLDAFIAGDSAEAKERVAEFLTSVDLRPRDVGGVHMASALESTGLLLMGVAQNGAGFDIALGADIL